MPAADHRGERPYVWGDPEDGDTIAWNEELQRWEAVAGGGGGGVGASFGSAIRLVTDPDHTAIEADGIDGQTDPLLKLSDADGNAMFTVGPAGQSVSVNAVDDGSGNLNAGLSLNTPSSGASLSASTFPTSVEAVVSGYTNGDAMVEGRVTTDLETPANSAAALRVIGYADQPTPLLQVGVGAFADPPVFSVLPDGTFDPPLPRQTSVRLFPVEAGNIVIDALSWQDFGPALSIPAVDGDVIEVSPAVTGSTGPDAEMDLVTVVSGSRRLYLSSRSTSQRAHGFGGWYSHDDLSTFGPTVAMVVAAADIVDGEVTLQIIAKATSSTRTFLAGPTDYPGLITIKNLGPVAA